MFKHQILKILGFLPSSFSINEFVLSLSFVLLSTLNVNAISLFPMEMFAFHGSHWKNPFCLLPSLPRTHPTHFIHSESLMDSKCNENWSLKQFNLYFIKLHTLSAATSSSCKVIDKNQHPNDGKIWWCRCASVLDSDFTYIELHG